MPVCPTEPYGRAARGNLPLQTHGRAGSVPAAILNPLELVAAANSQHVAVSWGQLGFVGPVPHPRSPSRSPCTGLPSWKGPGLVKVASTAPTHKLLCPWLLCDLFSITISYFPVSPPDLSPSSAQCREEPRTRWSW